MTSAARWTSLLLSVCGYLLVAGRSVAWERAWAPATALIAVAALATQVRGRGIRRRPGAFINAVRGGWAVAGPWQRAEIAAWGGLASLVLVSVVRGDAPVAWRAAAEWATLVGLGWAVAVVGRDAGRTAVARGAAIAAVVLAVWWCCHLIGALGGSTRPSGQEMGMAGRRSLAAMLLVGLLPGRLGRALEVLAAVTMGASTSRGALLGAAASLAGPRRRLAMAGLLLIALIAATSVLASAPLRPRRSAVLSNDLGVATSGRALVWRYSAAGAREMPCWGHGIGHGQAAYDRARLAAVARGGRDTKPALRAHNVVLQMGLDAGAPAAVLLLVAWVLSMRRLVVSDDRWGVGAASAWLAVGAVESVALECPMELLLTLALVPGHAGPPPGASGSDPAR